MDRSGSGAERSGGSSGSAPELVGATLGNYRISSLLGQGGMGSVYLGEHLLIGRKVAVKVLDPQVAGHSDVVSRFFVEARAVNEIRHPNIVEVTDLGTHQGRPFIVMEYLQGETLEARLGRVMRMSAEECVAIVRQVASALGAAHQQGMVHRDLKPANIMLCDHPDYPDFVKVLDFGIAKLLRATRPSKHQTVVGSLLGTPGYMSPEQCLGDNQLDHRSDVYSLGVILFLMGSGRPPFQDDTFGRLIVAHVHEIPPKLVDLVPGLPAGLSAAVEKALAKKPEDRFQTMREFRQALEATLGEATFPRSLTPVATGIRLPLPNTVRPAPAPNSSPATMAVPGTLTQLPSSEVLAERMEDRLREWLAGPELAVPALPASYLPCLELLRDPGFSFAGVADLIRRDARLLSHVVRRSNSDGRGRGVAATAEQAIGRLGALGLRAAIVELGVRRVVEVRHERMDEELRRPWQHALAGAIVAERLSRLAGLAETAYDAYLAALMRDFALQPVCVRLFELEWEINGRKAGRMLPVDGWLGIARRHHRTLAGRVVRAWGLSEDLAEALEGGPALDIAGATSLANLRRLGGALADREGFYLRHDALAEADRLVETVAQTPVLSDLKLAGLVTRLKEAVRLRE
jgi:serine/threonine protein kinase